MKMAVHGDANALSQLPDTMSLFLGNNPGCIGEVSALALLLGLVYMLWKKDYLLAYSCFHSGNRIRILRSDALG